MIQKKRLLIIGAGEAGELLLKDIKKNPLLRYWVVGFLDDNKEILSEVQKIKVLGKVTNVKKTVEDYNIEEIIIAIPSLKSERLNEVINICQTSGIEPKIMPSTYESLYSLKTGRPWYDPIRPVNLEDLLRRKPSNINYSELKKYIEGKNILVTGGGGSIGSELCRQIAEIKPGKLIVLDNNEYNLYEISLELSEKYKKSLKIKSVIGDIKDFDTISNVIKNNKIDIVFHAAAYKHVPLMEDNVREAIKNNIIGTYNVARASEEGGVKDFVFISTDKVVNPSSIMGSTKKIAEKVIRIFDKETKFVIVRFGNVLGSKGSVIPLFEKQIQNGGPITITHPHMRRYFMTIPEAVQLIIQAGTVGENGQIMILDMGKQHKIVDIAKQLIKLHSLVPDKDIKIKYIGLRPGEKLSEELLTEKENFYRTKNERIFVSQSEKIDKENLLEFLSEIQENINFGADKKLRKKIKNFINGEKKKILLTGSRGFIGQHLKIFLENKGYKIIEIDGDLTKKNVWENISKVDVLVHLASRIPQKGEDKIKEDLIVMDNSIEFCRKNECKIIFASSSVVYWGKNGRFCEDNDIFPESDYGEIKFLCEEKIKSVGLNGFILRLFNVYGKGQKEPFVVPSILAGINGKKIIIKKNIARDFIEVKDVLRAIEKCINKENQNLEIINIGSGKRFYLEEITELIKNISKKDIEVSIEENKEDVVYADIKKARRLLGWFPKISLRKGLKSLVENGV